MFWTKKQENRDHFAERKMMFKNLYCPNCGVQAKDALFIGFVTDEPTLCCPECSCNYTAEDLRERASEFARIAWALDAIAKVDCEDVGITVELEMKKETIYS